MPLLRDFGGWGMSSVRRFSEAYGGFIADYPHVMVVAVIVLYLLSSYGNTLLKEVAMGQKDMLPKDEPTVKSIDILQDEFGGTESALFVITLETSESGSNEPVDVRDPRVLEYADLLGQKAAKLEEVVAVSGPAGLVKADGRIPQSQKTINSLMAQNPQTRRYVSPDYSMALVMMTLTDNVDEDRVASELASLIEETPHPPGVVARPSGQVVVSSSIKSQIGPDMAKTGLYSLIGVIVLVMLTFGLSVRYSATSLLAIILGTTWSFGLMGFLGMSITSQTSAGLSMILGIGIDFGIQVVARYRIERRKHGVRRGMVETMDAVLVPMSTTTLAALIGFRAMSLGELTVLRDLATMMSLGVFCCMFAAITIVPVALIIGEKLDLGWIRERIGILTPTNGGQK
jgi:uncharacterized protein